MKRILLAVATVGALVGGGVLATQLSGEAPDANAAPAPQRIIIGLDLSRSNPLIADPAFAAKVADRIAAIVGNLGFASEVHVRTFGNYDATSNTFAYDTVLSVRNRPENVAAEIRKLIAGTPYLVRNGKWRAQENTNILAFLDNLSQSIGCAGMPTTIVLASDGIEDSDYARLMRRDAHLPPPDGRPFQGCADFEILGLGQGADSPRLTSHLRGEWGRWALAAGFARFEGLNDW
ncbi:MAG: hypothetical protein KGL56_01305 [Alphaproteobacteria bacterium]|nr:hypothetical protein [Alphaproteobacteria bacterium]MDE2161564.1 hypothetical protein [Alphaproteobacteria bacterium]MDE2498801.1 hypothetical protein [Alphaproteobacteria bacterium]